MSASPASPQPSVPPVSAARARLLVGLLGVFWGLNWIAVRFALDEVRPWGLRAIGMGLGALALFGWAAVRGRSLRVEPGVARRRLAIAGVLNIAAFGVFTAFAQLAASTSRVTIVTYTMPIWSVIFARLVLGERLDGWRTLALGLAACGLVVLIAPLLAPLRAGTLPAGALAGIGWALLAGIAWAAGTVYLKASRIEADPLAIAAWQLAAGFSAVAIGVLVFEGAPRGWPAQAVTWFAVAYHVLLGIALPYLLWFGIVGRTPAATAALGTLLVPVVAVLGAVALLGERPGPVDALGFVLIFGAAAAVLLRPTPAPSVPVTPIPRPGDPA